MAYKYSPIPHTAKVLHFIFITQASFLYFVLLIKFNSFYKYVPLFYQITLH